MKSKTNAFITPNGKSSFFTLYPGFSFLVIAPSGLIKCYSFLQTDSVMDMGNFYIFKNPNWYAVYKIVIVLSV